MDGQEWLASYQERLEQIRVRTTQAREELARTTGTATSRDGAVTVTVGPSGALQGLELGERSTAMTRTQLATLILDTAHQARADAARQTEAAMAPLLGESQAMNVLRDHLGLATRTT